MSSFHAAGKDFSADFLARLRQTLGEQLYRQAERLVEDGCVSQLRVLQAGAVITGIVDAGPQAARPAAGYRVYIQRSANGSDPGSEGECSCGERAPCVHVAAISIAAAKGASTPSVAVRTAASARPAVSAQGAPILQQRLLYVIEATDRVLLSAWISQRAADSERSASGNICPFVPRRAISNGGYPRYVDLQDREILSALAAAHTDGPWVLSGEVGARCLQQVAATGRAYLRSLQGRALKPGDSRAARFAWEVLPNGNQRLRCEAPASVEVLVDVEPVMYVDPAAGECGRLELPCPASLLRELWARPPVTPEQVPAVCERISLEPDAGGFPRPHDIPIRQQALTSLRAKLVLREGPEAALYFLYNGLEVADRELSAEQDTVRVMDGAVLQEISRDREGERRLRMRLEQALETARHGESTWLAFMLENVPALQADGWEVVVDERFPYRIASPGEWYADLQPVRSRDWFDLRLGIRVDGRPVNLLPALVGFLQSGRGETSDAGYPRVGDRLLVRLEDGRYLPVPLERIERIAETLVELFDAGGLGERQALRLPAVQAGRLAQLADGPQAPELQSSDPSLLARIEALRRFRGIAPVSAPSQFRAVLRPYQQEGLGWLQFLARHGLGGILADDMGLGKTVQTLAHLTLEHAAGRLRKPALIVAPVSVIGNWRQEIHRLAPDLRTLTLHGSRRRESFHAIGEVDVVITAYSLLLSDIDVLQAHEFSFVILDEAQMIKNPRAKVTQAARALRAEHRLCLTGTPMENHLGELWSLMEFVQPGYLGSESRFQREYRTPIEKRGDRARAAALGRRIAPFILRRTKEAVARDLPPKTEIIEPIALDERQRDFYDSIRLTMHRRVREAIAQQGLARSRLTVLDALLKLRQACCDPRLVDAAAAREEIPSAKLQWLSSALPELVAEGRRILLFSQFTSMLRLIADEVVRQAGIPHLMLTGETRERSALVARFQAGEVPLFLISLKAGGAGLNLTAADTVIHYDPWWNPAVDAQAADRAHRIGQDKPVFVYKLIAQDTVEEKIMNLQADKSALASLLDAHASASPGSLSEADLEALFEP